MRLATIIVWLIAMPAYGHHSMSEYSNSKITELTGEVAEVRWANPHIRLKLRTSDDDGNEKLWSLEALPRSQLDREGVPNDAVRAGDVVTIAGTPSTRRSGQMMVRNILLNDGTELMVHPMSEPRWEGQTLGGKEQSIGDSRVNEARETADGIFRVWVQETRMQWPDEFPLTTSAEEKRVAYDAVTDNPFADCTPPGMPRAITGAWPIEFVEGNGEIIIRLEDYGLVRTINMNSAAAASDRPAIPLGYSTGYWEGATLVVESSDIDYRYFETREGVPQSPGISVTERFTLSGDESRLHFELTAVDPKTFTQPVTGTRTWVWEPGTELKPYECAAE
jgi:hypothetical protein